MLGDFFLQHYSMCHVTFRFCDISYFPLFFVIFLQAQTLPNSTPPIEKSTYSAKYLLFLANHAIFMFCVIVFRIFPCTGSFHCSSVGKFQFIHSSPHNYFCSLIYQHCLVVELHCGDLLHV